ncbi:hypothetical protein Kpho01_74020 [Kitasatospora phosalacinea]|uniref:Uncharacterized protein n=1 Tax=Kitasatospora phosalacinea TaxID=2065 RepID=A0A9W6PRC2_9ACTN|nr:hypothetical protein Kpho01_74020 [Kitasatospora phosalacinea]
MIAPLRDGTGQGRGRRDGPGPPDAAEHGGARRPGPVGPGASEVRGAGAVGSSHAASLTAAL